MLLIPFCTIETHGSSGTTGAPGTSGAADTTGATCTTCNVCALGTAFTHGTTGAAGAACTTGTSDTTEAADTTGAICTTCTLFVLQLQMLLLALLRRLVLCLHYSCMFLRCWAFFHLFIPPLLQFSQSSDGPQLTFR